MRIYKTKLFAKWAKKERLNDLSICQAVREIKMGLVDGHLGEHVYKKRIGLHGRGKRGGARSIIAYQVDEKAFFIFGYRKGERENMTAEEQRVTLAFASEVLSYSADQLNKSVKDGVLIEVKYDG